MKAKYIANTQVCLSVQLSDGGNKHVSFSPITGGKSVFYTDDPALQEAMEHHHRYGKLFKRDATVASVATPKVAKKMPQTKALTAKEVKVSDLGIAREYLVSHFDVSRTKLRTKAQIEKIATNNNIIFVGL